MTMYNMFFYNIFFIASVLVAGFAQAQKTSQSFSTSSIEKQLASLDKEQKELNKEIQSLDTKGRVKEIKALKAKLVQTTGPERDVLSKKISLLSQDDQIVQDINYVYQQYKSLLEEHIKLLQEYKNDPEFLKLKMPLKTSYEFDEFEEVGRRLLTVKTKVHDLEKSRNAAYDDVQKRKKARSVIEEEYQEKIKQQEELNSSGTQAIHNKAQLVDLQKRLLQDKKTLAAAKVKEAEQRVAFLDDHLMITRAQLAQVKDSYETIKRALHVDESYLRKAEVALEKKRNESTVTREQLSAEIKSINQKKAEKHKKAVEEAEQLGVKIPDIITEGEWQKTPHTVQDWMILCKVGYSALEKAAIDLEREHKEARIELEKAKLRQEETQFAILQSWHTLTSRGLGFSSRALDKHLKAYEAPKAEIQGDLALLTEKRARALSVLQELYTTLERIKKLSASLAGSQAEFKEASTDFQSCIQRMHEAEDKTRQQMYVTAKLIELYSTAIATLEDTNKRIENVIAELGSKSFWRRSSLSITWDELKNFSPDIRRFLEDLGSSFFVSWSTFSWKPWHDWFTRYRHPATLLLGFLRVLIALVLFLLIRTYIPYVRDYFYEQPGYFGKSSVRLLIAFVLDFINNHLLGLYSWFLLYILIYYEYITNVHVALFFYLASIPYMLFIANQFITGFMAENDRLHQPFVSNSYKPRFLYVVPLFLYITIILFFFRQAFMMGNYHSSAVPAILLAVNYIVLQLALMSLISKEWILSMIPRSTPLWEWVYDHVDHYYYVIWALLIAVIIMSNPYVGYGRQVLYVLSRLVIIGILIPLLSYAYNRVRRISADLFFYYGDGETVKERFSSSRTLYGFFVVSMFCAFVILGVILGSRVLGYSFGVHDIFSWLQYELYSGVDEMGKRLSVTPITFLKIILFLVAGLVIAYIANNILLRRIFDPLLVSSGIQNTIFTFTRYAVIFIALLIGFKSVGLQSFATQIAVLLAGAGFIVKDPLLDFVSYFIILVQRPIKIGDLIMLDDDTTGIVRYITPRSVILRRKNSVTIIIPNSQIITRPVVNWNYSPTFFALNDIMITVPYTVDPEYVRSIILKVIGDNINILKSPAAWVLLNDFVDNGFQFLIRAYLTADKVQEQWEIASRLRLDIIKALRAAHIQVALPTRVLKVMQDLSDNIPLP